MSLKPSTAIGKYCSKSWGFYVIFGDRVIISYYKNYNYSEFGCEYILIVERNRYHTRRIVTTDDLTNNISNI